jgi:hypothetical protein
MEPAFPHGKLQADARGVALTFVVSGLRLSKVALSAKSDYEH